MLSAVVALAVLLGTAWAHESSVPVAGAAAKPCSAGWTHAVIGGEHKCLRAGQFCQRDADGQYHRYGFHCHRANGFRLARRVQRIQARITAVKDGNTLRVRAYGAKRKRYRVRLIGISTPTYPGSAVVPRPRTR